MGNETFVAYKTHPGDLKRYFCMLHPERIRVPRAEREFRLDRLGEDLSERESRSAWAVRAERAFFALGPYPSCSEPVALGSECQSCQRLYSVIGICDFAIMTFQIMVIVKS